LIKNKKQLVNLNESISRNLPTRNFTDQVFGKKTERSEEIGRVITFDYLNQALKQRLRD